LAQANMLLPLFTSNLPLLFFTSALPPSGRMASLAAAHLDSLALPDLAHLTALEPPAPVRRPFVHWCDPDSVKQLAVRSDLYDRMSAIYDSLLLFADQCAMLEMDCHTPSGATCALWHDDPGRRRNELLAHRIGAAARHAALFTEKVFSPDRLAIYKKLMRHRGRAAAPPLPSKTAQAACQTYVLAAGCGSAPAAGTCSVACQAARSAPGVDAAVQPLSLEVSHVSTQADDIMADCDFAPAKQSRKRRPRAAFVDAATQCLLSDDDVLPTLALVDHPAQAMDGHPESFSGIVKASSEHQYAFVQSDDFRVRFGKDAFMPKSIARKFAHRDAVVFTIRLDKGGKMMVASARLADDRDACEPQPPAHARARWVPKAATPPDAPDPAVPLPGLVPAESQVAARCASAHPFKDALLGPPSRPCSPTAGLRKLSLLQVPSKFRPTRLTRTSTTASFSRSDAAVAAAAQ